MKRGLNAILISFFEQSCFVQAMTKRFLSEMDSKFARGTFVSLTVNERNLIDQVTVETLFCWMPTLKNCLIF